MINNCDYILNFECLDKTKCKNCKKYSQYLEHYNELTKFKVEERLNSIRDTFLNVFSSFKINVDSFYSKSAGYLHLKVVFSDNKPEINQYLEILNQIRDLEILSDMNSFGIEKKIQYDFGMTNITINYNLQDKHIKLEVK